jgi:16S rRNA (uracil1498-N3)-methyltransferase
VITAIGKRSASARLIDQTWPQTEAVTQITIAQALPKMNEKMEQVLQRGTEIGVHAFRAFNSARSLPHLAGERQEKRLQRWTAIVKTAAEQSHRALLPSIAATDTYNDILASAPQYDLTLLAYEGEHERSLKTVLRSLPTPSRSVLVIVGPESGLTEDEARCAETAGAIPVTLGPRILRTETAAMIAAAQILYEWED